MGNKNPRVDAYIAKAAPFAQPILNRLRTIVHKACPQVEENIKWGMPSFDFQGSFCDMAAFKQHCSFGFRKASLMKDAKLLNSKENRTAMGNLGRIVSIADIPAERKMMAWIREAIELNMNAVKVPKKNISATKIVVDPPDWLLKAIQKNKLAWKSFQAFTPGKKKEYIEWLTEAKSEETRNRRLIQALAWIEEGKSRNWKYMKGAK